MPEINIYSQCIPLSGGDYGSIQDLIRLAVESRASDIIITGGKKPWIRVDGDWKIQETYKELPNSTVEGVVRALIPRERLMELQDPTKKGTDASYHDQEIGRRFRINVSHSYAPASDTSFGYEVCIRVLDSRIPDITDIGFPNEEWQNIIALTEGLVLVTGVTGSGKSTTLASLIEEINKTQRRHIITLEQPVEYVFEDKMSVVSQHEIPLNVLSFADGVRAALRQAPNVILVGEVRDSYTAEAAIHAAETGHLVFATLHTTDAQESITRMVGLFHTDLEPKVRYDLASNVKYILSQKLLPRREGIGRVLAMEVFVNSPASKELIRNPEKTKQITNYMQINQKIGNVLMDDCILALYRRGVINEEVAIATSHYPTQIREKILSSGGGPSHDSF